MPIAALATAAVLLVVGCASSKPSFCGETTKLAQSVKNIDVSGGPNSLNAQLQQIENYAKNVVTSASKDFPNETTAISNSLVKLQTDLKTMTSAPSVQEIASIASDANALVDAVGRFVDASKSKCK